MKPNDVPAPVAYENAQEWLEGKRRFVEALRRLCGNDGTWRERRNAGADRETLQAALNWYEDQHLVRMAATAAAEYTLPIDAFAAAYELDDTEREIVELLLVDATDLARDEGHGLSAVELARLLARGRQDAVQQYLRYFLPGCRLRDVVNFRDAFGRTRLSLDEETVGELTGAEEQRCERAATPALGTTAWDGDLAEFLSRSGVVLGASALDSLRTVWGFVRRHEVINGKWGFGALAQLPSGACLLFHGPSGTGKTLTARALSRALGREPLVVSYPDLVSKWVGDTEKNTKGVFGEAARTGKVLVFDEADAIFARRTEVTSSCDRYANGHVNTLLMELERFPGIVILTTNHAGVLDPALERRIRHKVHFGPPDAAARTGIWRKHLPKEAPLAPDVDLDRLGLDYKLTGGQIANAVLTAASLAAARLDTNESTGQITMADLEAAARREGAGYASDKQGGQLGF